MNKIKAIGGCLGTFLLSALGVGLVGWIITAIFPKSYTVVSYIGGFIVIIALWNAIDTFVKILKQKGEATPSPESKPTDPSTPGQ
jgi:cytochrome c biogenesis protein CcdA